MNATVRRILAAIDRDKAEPWKAAHVLELELVGSIQPVTAGTEWTWKVHDGKADLQADPTDDRAW